MRLGRSLLMIGVLGTSQALCQVAWCAPDPIAICVDPSPFHTIREAAQAESSVSWDSSFSRSATACTQAFAALELRHFLAERMQVRESTIVLTSSRSLPERGRVFLLTSDASDPRFAGLDTSRAPRPMFQGGEGFRVFTSSEPGRTVYVVQGAGRVGTLYGVYDLLERFGVRFYGLGANGTVFLERGANLPADVEALEQPGYVVRGFWSGEARGSHDFFLWMARNRLNLWTALEPEAAFLHKLGFKLTQGGHVIQKSFLNPAGDYPYRHPPFPGASSETDPYPPSPQFLGDRNGDGRLSYFEAHPEWFGEVDGKRSPRILDAEGDNMCTSNPDVGSPGTELEFAL